jgi:hypothetical protein
MNLFVLIFIISIVISIFIIYPLLRKYLWNNELELKEPFADPKYTNLLREKDLILNEIKDIDLDYGLEKLNENDYKELRQKYRIKAAEIIKKIESYQKLSDFKIDTVISGNIDKEIEARKATK